MASCARVRCRAARALAVARSLPVAALASRSQRRSRRRGAAAAASTAATPPVRLLHVTPVVVDAGPAGRSSRSRGPGPRRRRGATVQLTLYSRLTTRSASLAAISAAGPDRARCRRPAAARRQLPRRGSAVCASRVAVAPDGVAVARRRAVRAAARRCCGSGARRLRRRLPAAHHGDAAAGRPPRSSRSSPMRRRRRARRCASRGSCASPADPHGLAGDRRRRAAAASRRTRPSR